MITFFRFSRFSGSPVTLALRTVWLLYLSVSPCDLIISSSALCASRTRFLGLERVYSQSNTGSLNWYILLIDEPLRWNQVIVLNTIAQTTYLRHAYMSPREVQWRITSPIDWIRSSMYYTSLILSAIVASNWTNWTTWFLNFSAA